MPGTEDAMKQNMAHIAEKKLPNSPGNSVGVSTFQASNMVTNLGYEQKLIW